ncbi:MAG: ParB/RepB/Spo0J family partition protein [Patescibacteria group bacterium]|jgi:ParB family chromosome partitioning protein
MQKIQGGLGRGLGALLPSTNHQSMSDVSFPIAIQPSTSEEAHHESLQTVHVQPMPRLENTANNDRLLQISPNDIVANPRQPRQYFAAEELSDLVASIKEHGILQPLVVTELATGIYELISGERRLRAARAVGLATVPVIVRKANDQQKLELALIENIQRADLNAVEEARAYRQLMEDFGLTQEDVAGRVGKSRSQIANVVRLLELPSDMLVAVIDGRISKSHARTLLSESNEERRRALFARMLNGGVSVRNAEESTSRRAKSQKDPNIIALEETLREKLGTKVTIDVKGAEGTIAIHCYSKEDLADMVRRLHDAL